MAEYQLGAMESRFAEMVWTHAPISTAELVKRCEAELNWKRTTTYTVLKRLCEKGLFAMRDGTVTVLVDRDTFYARQSRQYVDTAFQGSLPAFLTAFSKRRRLSEKEIEDLEKIIAQMKE